MSDNYSRLKKWAKDAASGKNSKIPYIDITDLINEVENLRATIAATEAAKATGTAGESLPRYKLVSGEQREWMMPAPDGDWCRYDQVEIERQPATATIPPVVGVSRDVDSPGMTGVLVTFARPLSDGQLRELHEYLNRSQP